MKKSKYTLPSREYTTRSQRTLNRSFFKLVLDPQNYNPIQKSCRQSVWRSVTSTVLFKSSKNKIINGTLELCFFLRFLLMPLADGSFPVGVKFRSFFRGILNNTQSTCMDRTLFAFLHKIHSYALSQPPCHLLTTKQSFNITYPHAVKLEI